MMLMLMIAIGWFAFVDRRMVGLLTDRWEYD